MTPFEQKHLEASNEYIISDTSKHLAQASAAITLEEMKKLIKWMRYNEYSGKIHHWESGQLILTDEQVISLFLNQK